jgi:hypothetical protein
MTGGKTVANRKTSTLVRPPQRGNLQFSNRQLPLLESHLSPCKQTIAPGSNRNFLRSRHFEPKPPLENRISQRLAFRHRISAISYPIFGDVTRL